jgi:hypothetical protein
MGSEPPRKRQGLEGLPVNSDEVMLFDVARGHASDLGALVFLGVFLLGVMALAVWDGAVELVAITGVLLLLLGWWTVSKVRRWAAAEYIERRARERDANQ